MELLLIRVYYDTGTNGCLFAGDELLCFTTEAASHWEDYRGCLPEGKYLVSRFPKSRHAGCLQLKHMEDRQGGLIQCKPDLSTMTAGCIVPATLVTAPGKGLGSKRAMELLVRYTGCFGTEPIYLTIKS